MLALLLSAGEHRYALPCSRVREVISCVALRPLAGAAPYVAGVFNYRGTVTPVVDFCLLSTGVACAPRLSSRIVLFDLPRGPTLRPVGLLAERVTETRQLEVRGPVSADLSRLGRVLVDGGIIINLLELDELLERAFAELPQLGGDVPSPHVLAEHRH